MAQSPIRPREGDEITVMFDGVAGPMTHLARAGAVRASTLIVPHGHGDQSRFAQPQDQAMVLFSQQGRLYSWLMTVEEVLPSSYYLVSLEDPTSSERRGFVRAPVQLRFCMTRTGQARSPWYNGEVDLSSAGMRLRSLAAQAEPDEVVDLVLRADGWKADVVARARVVRSVPTDSGSDLALEFTQLSSADSEKLQSLVFRVREEALLDRIGQRGNGRA